MSDSDEDEEDDWFEQALGESEADADPEDEDWFESEFEGAEESESAVAEEESIDLPPDDEPEADAGDEIAPDSADDVGAGDDLDLEAEFDATVDSEPDADEPDPEAEADESALAADAAPEETVDESGTDRPGVETGDDTDTDADAGFGMDAESPSEDGEDLFGEDFAAAFQNAPAPGESGGALDAGVPAEGSFEEEDFDSAIPRIDVGIEGLDEMIQGGVPERSLMVAIGNAGTGKTTFGLQFVRHGLENGENAVFIALEENYDRIVNTADDKGWDFSTYLRNDQLAVLDLDPIEMANSLTSIRSDLPHLVRDFGASRLVLDSVSLLEMMYDDQATRRNEIYDFTQSLKAAGVTTMLTSEAGESDPYNSRFGIIEYLTDAVFVLRYIRPDDFRETRLAVEIQKIRDANHSREMKPYEITNEGINVYRQANIF